MKRSREQAERWLKQAIHDFEEATEAVGVARDILDQVKNKIMGGKT